MLGRQPRGTGSPSTAAAAGDKFLLIDHDNCKTRAVNRTVHTSNQHKALAARCCQSTRTFARGRPPLERVVARAASIRPRGRCLNTPWSEQAATSPVVSKPFRACDAFPRRTSAPAAVLIASSLVVAAAQDAATQAARACDVQRMASWAGVSRMASRAGPIHRNAKRRARQERRNGAERAVQGRQGPPPSAGHATTQPCGWCGLGDTRVVDGARRRRALARQFIARDIL